MKRILLIILALGSITIQAQTPEAKLIKEFDAYVEKSRKQYHGNDCRFNLPRRTGV